MSSGKTWKIALGPDDATYITGVDYGDNEVNDVRNLMMFMIDENRTKESDPIDFKNLENGYTFIKKSPLYSMNQGELLTHYFLNFIFNITCI